MKKHILVISQYFYPEQFRINDICTEWVNRGYKVTVITGIPNYPEGKFYENYSLFRNRKENYQGVEVVRLPLIPRGNSSIMLALNYLSFVVSGYFWKVFTRIKADAVFIFEVSPMTQALPGVWYAKKRKIPCYLYVQDLWPENVEIITGISNKRIIGSIGKMVDYIYQRCTMILTTSESFIESIHERGVPLKKLEYWPQYAESFYVPLKKDKVDVAEISKDSFNIVFTGNIGKAQGLEILPKSAELIKAKTDKKIQFNIIGDGRYKQELVEMVNKMKLNEMFNFIPKQPATKISEYLAASDVAFLGLLDNRLFEMTIPAKLQTYLACGIPIVASAAGETEKNIRESKAGLCGRPGNEFDLAMNIIQLANTTKEELNQMGLNAHKYSEKHFNKNKLLNRMDFYYNISEKTEENYV